MSNISGLSKNKFCQSCNEHRYRGEVCPGSRIETDWKNDSTGKSRTVSGGVCAKIEDYNHRISA